MIPIIMRLVRRLVCDNALTARRGMISTFMTHRPWIVKSSNAMTESALVHSPTLPASLNV
jgi:hypothetical protein